METTYTYQDMQIINRNGRYWIKIMCVEDERIKEEHEIEITEDGFTAIREFINKIRNLNK